MENHLNLEVGGSFTDENGGKIYWDGVEPVNFEHKEFQWALWNTINHLGYINNPLGIDLEFVKINTIEDAGRLQRGEEYRQRKVA